MMQVQIIRQKGDNLKVEELPTLYSVDIVKMDDCTNELLLEDIRQYGREI